MTDGSITLNAGAGGENVATDEIAGSAYQRVKLNDGTQDSTTAIAAGNGTAANALRVTVASDTTGVLSVDDNGTTLSVDDGGGVLTVDGTVAVTGVATAANQLPDGHNVTVDNASIAVTNAGLTELAAAINVSSQMDVNLAASAATVTVDNAGTFAVQSTLQTGANTIGEVTIGAASTAAGDLAKAEDAVHATGDVGVMGLFVRQDTQADFGADGDYVPGSVDANGALRVNAINADGTSNVDTAAGGTDAGAVMLAVRDDALTTLTPVDGDYVHLRTNSTGALHVTGAGGGTQYNVDDVAGATDTGTLSLAIRDDALTALTPADGDYVGLRVNSTGALHVTGAGGGTQYNISDVLGATDTTTLAGVVRDDVLTTLTEADGDVSVLRVNSTGALHVTGGGGGTEYTQDVAATDPATAATTMMVRDDVLATQETADGDWTVPRTNARGAQWVQLDQNGVDVTVTETNSAAILADTANMDTNLGTLAGAVTGTEMQVDVITMPTTTVTGTVTADLGATDNAVLDQIEVNTSYGDNTGNGTAAGALRVTVASDSTGSLAVDLGANNDVTIDNSSIVQAEDAVHVSGDAGVMTLAVRNDDLAALAGTDGDYAPLQVDEFGAVYVTDRSENMYRNIDANAEAAIKASAGTLNWIHAINLTAAMAYLHLYNATTGTVVPGTTVPDLTFPIPTQGDTNGAGFNLKLNQYFDTAITLVVTTTNNGAAGDPGTNGVFINAGYT